MPLVAHLDLPTFQRLRHEGEDVLDKTRAQRQDIRALHIGLLNMMPDTALEATERQFFRLVGACNQIAQFYVHPFTIEGLERSPQAQAHIDQYYQTFAEIKREGLDALIISGANVTHAHLEKEAFWQPLTEVFDWAKQNVTSTLCSCLATHAIIQYCHGIRRIHYPQKRWGVFRHKITDKNHPLVVEMNTCFDVPHSRFNDISQSAMEEVGIKVLAMSEEVGVHLAVSPDGFRFVYFQGHPEYDDISLLKEYKREVTRFFNQQRADYPPFPAHYFNTPAQTIFNRYQQQVISAQQLQQAMPAFPQAESEAYLENTWRDTAKAVFNNWLGKVYQITHQERSLPFMVGIDPENPLNLK